MGRLASVLILTAAAVGAQEGEQAVRAVLVAQQAAWNRGDVRAFMDGYDESAVFVGTEVTKGRAAILERYQKRYANREQMGELAFSGLEIRPLCDGWASVIGRWHLKRSAGAGGDAGGAFTLLFHRTPGGWKIVLDHTS